MKLCIHCNRVTSDPKQQYCLGCGGVEFTTLELPSAPKAAIVPAVSAPKAEAPRQQVEEEKPGWLERWFVSATIPTLIFWWIIGCFGVYLLWVYAMPTFWGWAMTTGEFLLVNGLGWIVGGWWATPWQFFQVIAFVVMGILVLLAWLVTALPVIFVLIATFVVAIPLLMLLAGM